jgi:hypothetical protein
VVPHDVVPKEEYVSPVGVKAGVHAVCAYPTKEKISK